MRVAEHVWQVMKHPDPYNLRLVDLTALIGFLMAVNWLSFSFSTSNTVGSSGSSESTAYYYHVY